MVLPPPAPSPPPAGNSHSASVHSLPLGTQLAEFELRGVLGEGGFAIVYRAHDQLLRRTVAIKEFFPGALATRAADGSMIAREAAMQESLQRGLNSFLSEARMLAQFDHPALIRVHRFWQENRTAYMAMQLCQGRTLRAFREAEPQLAASEPWLKHMLSPILDALELLHARQCYHRDISPDNIMILDTGVPMLLDFGAARQVLGDATQAMTVILKPGYAPIEQYDSVLEQGPWTDIYSLGAVLHFLVTGQPVTASVSRLLRDPLPKLAETPGLAISPAFARAIDRALTVHPNERIRSVAEFREALVLPTFWVEMQKQSVELGALRRHAGGTDFSPLPAAASAQSASAPWPAHEAGSPVETASTAQPPQASQPPQTDRHSAGQPATHSTAPVAPAAQASRVSAQHPRRLRLATQRRLVLGASAVFVVALAGWLATGLRPAPSTGSTAPPPPPAPASAASASSLPAAATGQLLLDIHPWGVVYVNGEMQGLSPPLKVLPLPPGTYRIEVHNTGLPVHARTITVPPDQSVQLRHNFQ